jgi:hypothetical protein
MKISLHIEADSAEEMTAALAVFHVNQLSAEELEAKEVLLNAEIAEMMAAKAARVAQQEPKPVEPEPAPAPEPEPEKPAEPAVAAAKPRGRPRIVPTVEAPVEAPKPAPKPKAEPIEVVSRQDLLDVFAEYVQRYSANFGYTDISNLLQQHLGDGVRKASDVPDTMLPVAINAIKAAIIDNPFNRKRDYA